MGAGDEDTKDVSVLNRPFRVSADCLVHRTGLMLGMDCCTTGGHRAQLAATANCRWQGDDRLQTLAHRWEVYVKRCRLETRFACKELECDMQHLLRIMSRSGEIKLSP